MTHYETLDVATIQSGVLRVALNRPQSANALNTQMARDLLALWHGIADDPGETRCVILTGTGDRVFCAGADLKERNGMSDADWQAQHVLFERQYQTLLEVQIPVIAAINGHAYAGGVIGAVRRRGVAAPINDPIFGEMPRFAKVSSPSASVCHGAS